MEDAELRIVSTTAGQVGYHVQGKGPLVLIIASTGRCCAELQPFAAALTHHGFRVAQPEPRGIAPSLGPMTNANVHDYAADFAAVIAAELPEAEGDAAIVAGHAYGSWVARTMASDYPALVGAVVLLASGARKWPAALSTAITQINDPATSTVQRRAALQMAFFAEGNDPQEWMTNWHADVVVAQRAARAATPQSDWWLTGDVPILDLMGAADPFRPPGSENDLRDEFGDRVTVHAIANASHAMPAEMPRPAADAIAAWWQRINP